MPSLGGALGGAGTGAQVGSIFGPWGAGIGAAVGGIAGLFTGGKSKLQKQLEAKIDPGLSNLMKWSGESRNNAAAMYGMSVPALKQALGYYKALLDSPSEALRTAAPASNERYQGVLQQIAQFAPRGGGRNQLLSNFQFAKNAEQDQLIAGARGEAAQGLGQLGATTGSQALQWDSLSTQQQQAALALIQGLLTGQLNEQARKDQGWASVLQGLGPLLTDILGQVKGRRGGGGGFGGIVDSPLPGGGGLGGGGYA